MDQSKVMLTIKLKLHKPSKRKKEIIDEAMLHYTRACQFLLELAKKDIGEIERRCIAAGNVSPGKFKASNLGGWMDKEVCKLLNQFDVEPFKDSIKIDVASMIATYLTLKGKNSDVKYPVIYSNNKESIPACDESVPEMNGPTTIRPVFFCRYALNRNYSILFNASTRKYYAKIYLMNVRSDKRITSKPMTDKTLVYIDKNKTIFNGKDGKKTYVIFPLSFGTWQENYLKEAMEKPEILKTARLIKEKNEYFLSINLGFERPESIETISYLGVSRGISNILNYSIVDLLGQKISYGAIRASEQITSTAKLYKIANDLLDIARTNKSKVIVEKLASRNDGLEFVDKTGKVYSPAMDCKTYNKLCDILDYKLVRIGLSKPVRASAVNLFCTCTNCGTAARSNRFSKEIFICTNCAKTTDIETLGSENLARRLIKYKDDKIKIKVENQDGKIKFVNYDLELDFSPRDPFDCMDEFKIAIDRLVENFSTNMKKEIMMLNFKKKYSLIKKLESANDVLSVIHLE